MVWNFCDGWNPPSIPIAMAYLQVRDAAGVMDRVVALRAVLAERREAEKGR